MFQFNRFVGVAVLFAIAFAAAPTTAIAQASEPVEWKVSDGGNGHWYQALTLLTTRTNALKIAADSAAYLTTITFTMNKS